MQQNREPEQPPEQPEQQAKTLTRKQQRSHSSRQKEGTGDAPTQLSRVHITLETSIVADSCGDFTGVMNLSIVVTAVVFCSSASQGCRRYLNVDLLCGAETGGSKGQLSLDPEPRKRRKLAEPGSAAGKAAAPVDAIVPKTEPSAKEVPTSATESTPKGKASKRRPDQVPGAVTPRRCCHHTQEAFFEELSVQQTAWRPGSAERTALM